MPDHAFHVLVLICQFNFHDRTFNDDLCGSTMISSGTKIDQRIPRATVIQEWSGSCPPACVTRVAMYKCQHNLLS